MTNWKTTVTALIGALVILVNKYAHLDLPSDVIIILVVAAISLFTKDYDTTGTGVNARKPADDEKK